MPFFSVIIPLFNSEITIAKTLRSVSQQSFNDFEVIIVDDGSTDNSVIEIQPFLTDERFCLIQQENEGVSAARNKGAERANGEYFAFLDSDDLLTPNWLSDFHACIMNGKNDLCFCGASFDFRRQIQVGEEKFLAGTFCIRKGLFFEAGGYDKKLNYAENTELGWRVLDLQPKIGQVDNVNFTYIRGGKDGLHYLKNRLHAFYYLSGKHQHRFTSHPIIGQSYFQIAAVDNIRLGNCTEGRRLMWKGWLFRPFNLKALARALFTLNDRLAETVWKPVLKSGAVQLRLG
jgi:glycosyltransferase involved in cell wall biosynthesis